MSIQQIPKKRIRNLVKLINSMFEPSQSDSLTLEIQYSIDIDQERLCPLLVPDIKIVSSKEIDQSSLTVYLKEFLEKNPHIVSKLKDKQQVCFNVAEELIELENDYDVDRDDIWNALIKQGLI